MPTTSCNTRVAKKKEKMAMNASATKHQASVLVQLEPVDHDSGASTACKTHDLGRSLFRHLRVQPTKECLERGTDYVLGTCCFPSRCVLCHPKQARTNTDTRSKFRRLPRYLVVENEKNIAVHTHAVKPDRS